MTAGGFGGYSAGLPQLAGSLMTKGLPDGSTSKPGMKTPSTSAATDVDQTDALPAELKNAREAKGLSFSDVHRVTGISRTTLHDYESGRSKPGAREIVKLCDALEISPNRLLLGSETTYVGTGGVLLSIVGMARKEPGKAAVLSGFLVPLLTAVLSKIGNESLVAIATITDETLRARDPETFKNLATLVAEFAQFDLGEMTDMTPEQQVQAIRDIIKKSGLPSPENVPMS